MSSNIALFGMMGSGKSTVGRALSARLGRGFADTDAEIVRWRGATIPEIFEAEGEPAFRAYEARVVRELATFQDLVLALGGGVVLDDGNVADLALTGILVHLKASPDVLVERLTDEAAGRPLLAGDDLEGRIHALLDERAARYAEVADVVLDADKQVMDVVDDLIAWLVEHPDMLTPSEFEAVMT